VLFSGASWATDASCPGSPTNVLFGSGTNPTGAANGCSVVNLNFTNIGVNGNGPNILQVDAAGSGTTTALPMSVTFSAPTSGSGCAAGTTLWCASSTDSVVETLVSYTAAVNQSLVAPPPNEYFAVTSLTLALGSPANNGGNFSELYVEETYCVGVSTSAGCTTANTGVIEYVSENVSGSVSSSFTACQPGETVCTSSATVTFANPGYTQIYITDLVEPSWNVSGTVSLGSVTNTYDETAETPEPATFSLLVAGLAAAWLLGKMGRLGPSQLASSGRKEL
jgi:hypothetical protein